MSPSRILGFRQSTWVVFFLMTVTRWSMFGYQLLLISLNLITTIFFRIPLEKLLPKDSFVLSEYWMNLHLPLWVALFFVKNISRRLCAVLPISWVFVLILMSTNGLITRCSLESVFERAAGFRFSRAMGGTEFPR